MTIDSRGRRAGEDFRRAIDDLRSSAPDRQSIARFERVLAPLAEIIERAIGRSSRR